MPKRLILPDEVFIQRVQEGTDEPYYLAYSDIEDIDLTNGDLVGVYDLNRIVQVVEPSREIAEVK